MYKHRLKWLSLKISLLVREKCSILYLWAFSHFSNVNEHVYLLFFLGFDIQNLGSSSYSSLSINLFDFKAIDGLPIALSKRIENFGSANQLAEKLATEKSIFHKNCASRYNKSKLARHEEKSDPYLQEPPVPFCGNLQFILA